MSRTIRSRHVACLCAAILAWTGVSCASAYASRVKYPFFGTFADQGAFDGYFVFDTSVNKATDWSITTTTGNIPTVGYGGSGIVPGYTYTPTTSDTSIQGGYPTGIGIRFTFQDGPGGTIHSFALNATTTLGVAPYLQIVNSNSSETYQVNSPAIVSLARQVIAFNGGQPPSWNTAPPVIVALDGITAEATITLGLTGTATKNYLKSAPVSPWNYPNITSILWTGELEDVSQLRGYLLSAETLILKLLAQYPSQPIVVVGHSWGSVIAYEALQELLTKKDGSGRRIVPPGSIAGLITMGSPLAFNANRLYCKYIGGLLRAGFILFPDTPGKQYIFVPNIARPDVVSFWRNYWIAPDCISSKKTGQAANSLTNVRLPFPDLPPARYHLQYFEYLPFAQQELREIKKALVAVCKSATPPRWQCKPVSSSLVAMATHVRHQ